MDGLTLVEEKPEKPLVQVLKSEKFGDENSMQTEADDNNFDQISDSQDGNGEALNLRIADKELSSQIR